MLITMHNRST